MRTEGLLAPVSPSSRRLPPQAKGRIERVNFTLQQRLVAELHRHGITSIDKANEFVNTHYHHSHNFHFSHPPLASLDAHVKVLDPHPLDSLFAYTFQRTLRNDCTITVHTRIFQIILAPRQRILRKSHITCMRHLDNSLHLFYHGTKLSFKEVF